MKFNSISYVLDYTVSVPEIGLLAAMPDRRKILTVDRRFCQIDSDTSEVIMDSVRNAFLPGLCVLIEHVEYPKSDKFRIRKNTKRKLYFELFHDVNILPDSMFFHCSETGLDALCNLVNELINEQIMFVLLFGIDIERRLTVPWDATYGIGHAQIAEILKTGEIALFRANLKSQDAFELATVRILPCL